MVALDISVVGAPAWVAGTSAATVNPTYPTGIQANDRLILIIHSKQTTAAGSTIATPSGWTLVDQRQVGSTAAPGNGAGSTRIAIFSKTAAGTETGAHGNINVLNGNSSAACIQAWRAAGTGVTWTETYIGNANRTSAVANWGGNHNTSATAWQAKDKGIITVSVADDTAIPVGFTGLDGSPAATFTGAAKLPATDYANTTGNDISGSAGYATCNGGTGGAAGVINTGDSLATSETSGSILIRLRADGSPPPNTGSATGTFNYTGEALSKVVAFSDDFNRSNGAIGSNWVVTSGVSISSNQALMSNIYEVARTSTATKSGMSQFAEITLPSGTPGGQGPAVAIESFTGGVNPDGGPSAYWLKCTSSGMSIVLKGAGFQQSVLGTNGTGTTAGDRMKITWDGTIIRAFKNGSQVFTHTPSGGAIRPLAANPYVGFMNDSTTANMSVDDFRGGWFDLPPPPTGTASGTWNFTGAAAGAMPKYGSATGSFSFTGAAVGADQGVRINLLPNPSLETNTTGWANHSNASINNPTTTSVAGAKSLSITNSAVTTSAHAKYDSIPVLPSTTYNFSVSARGGSTDLVARIQVFYFTSGAVDDGNSSQVNTAIVTGSFTRGEVSFTTGASTSNVSLRVILMRAGALSMSAFGYTMYVDAMLLEQTSGTAGTYFDGDTTDASWTGTAHNSTSVILKPAGPTIPAGSGSGSWSFSGAASGTRTPKASATGTWTFAGAAAGKKPQKGTATGSFAFAGTTAGKRTPKASGTGTLAYVGAAVGKETPKGSSTGSWTFTGAAAGKKPQKGSATGTFAYVGAAVGLKGPGRGASTGTFTFTGAATGARTPKASASGSLQYVGISAGDMPPDYGSAAGTVSFAGSATGQRAPKASATGTFAYVGTTQAKTEHRGSASGTLAYTGTAVGHRAPKASAAGTITQTAAVRNYAPHSNGTSTSAGHGMGIATVNITVDNGIFHRSPSSIKNVVTSANAHTTGFAWNTPGLNGINDTYSWSVWVLASRSQNLRPYGEYNRITNTYGFVQGDPVAVTAGEWLKLACTATITDIHPSSTPSFGWLVSGTVQTGDEFWADEIVVVRGNNLPPYFDSDGTTIATGAFGVEPAKGSATGSWSFTGSTAAGVRTPKASASGTWNIAGLASGDVPPNRGLATGSWSFAGNTPVGTRASRGSATGSFTFTGTTVGTKPSKGSTTGQFTFAGAASGKRTPKASAAGTLAYVVTTAAKTEHRGVGVGSFTFTGVAVSATPKSGTGSGTWTFTNTQTVGRRIPKASGVGLWQFIGVGAGDAPANRGAATGLWSFAGVGAGKKTQVGSASGSFTYSSTAIGDALPNRGTAAGSWGYSGAAIGKRAPVSNGTGTFTFTGAGVGKEPAKGSSSGAWSFSSAAVGNGNTGGNATGQMHFAGAANGYVAKRGAASGTFVHTSHAVGSRRSGGISTGSWSYSSTAIGRRVPKGSCTGTWTYSSTTSAATIRRGSASGVYTYAGSGAGRRHQNGVSSGAWSYTGGAFGGSGRLRKVRINGTMVRVQRRVIRV